MPERTQSGWYPRGSPVVQFRADDPLAADLGRRGGTRGRIAKRDLTRYYLLINETERRLPLAPDDRLEIVRALRVYPRPLPDPQWLWTAIQRSPYWSEAGRSEEHGNELAGKIRKLTDVQRVALADWVDRVLDGGMKGEVEFLHDLQGARIETLKQQLLS
jgi:hypothetical protein